MNSDQHAAARRSLIEYHSQGISAEDAAQRLRNIGLPGISTQGVREIFASLDSLDLALDQMQARSGN